MYIMASLAGMLYTGVTGRLYVRVAQHKSGEMEGFTKQYGCKRLVYYECYGNVHDAIAREKEVKGWSRAKKVSLIEKANPRWKDLAENWGREMLFKGQSIKEAEQRQRIWLKPPQK